MWPLPVGEPEQQHVAEHFAHLVAARNQKERRDWGPTSPLEGTPPNSLPHTDRGTPLKKMTTPPLATSQLPLGS